MPRAACLVVALAVASLTALRAKGQTLGGQSAYGFLRLPGSPQMNALGTVNVSSISRDIALASGNPALLGAAMHGQVLASFNMFHAGIRQLHAMGGWHHERWGTTFSAGALFMDYGQVPQTDPAGNMLGTFRALDHSVSLTASRKYLERWHYGMTLKFVGSNYGVYRSSALMADMGIRYTDSASGFQAGFLASNMGLQLKTYAGTGEDLPFDLQLGVTKRLSHAPLQFSVTAHRLHRFDILYRDTAFNNENFGSPGPAGFAENLFRHFVFAAQAFPGEKVELTIGFNALRRSELSVYRAANGMTGFSFGAGVLLKRMQVRYARSIYSNGIAFNQFGLNIDLSTD
jgi:hypothetical protein